MVRSFDLGERKRKRNNERKKEREIDRDRERESERESERKIDHCNFTRSLITNLLNQQNYILCYFEVKSSFTFLKTILSKNLILRIIWIYEQYYPLEVIYYLIFFHCRHIQELWDDGEKR